MSKLTKVQRSALESVNLRNGYYDPWCLGTRTCEALRKRGLITTSTGQDIPFGGRFGYNPAIWITDAGRAALNTQEADRG